MKKIVVLLYLSFVCVGVDRVNSENYTEEKEKENKVRNVTENVESGNPTSTTVSFDQNEMLLDVDKKKTNETSERDVNTAVENKTVSSRKENNAAYVPFNSLTLLKLRNELKNVSNNRQKWPYFAHSVNKLSENSSVNFNKSAIEIPATNSTQFSSDETGNKTSSQTVDNKNNDSKRTQSNIENHESKRKQSNIENHESKRKQSNIENHESKRKESDIENHESKRKESDIENHESKRKESNIENHESKRKQSDLEKVVESNTESSTNKRKVTDFKRRVDVDDDIFPVKSFISGSSWKRRRPQINYQNNLYSADLFKKKQGYYNSLTTTEVDDKKFDDVQSSSVTENSLFTTTDTKLVTLQTVTDGKNNTFVYLENQTKPLVNPGTESIQLAITDNPLLSLISIKESEIKNKNDKDQKRITPSLNVNDILPLLNQPIYTQGEDYPVFEDYFYDTDKGDRPSTNNVFQLLWPFTSTTKKPQLNEVLYPKYQLTTTKKPNYDSNKSTSKPQTTKPTTRQQYSRQTNRYGFGEYDLVYKQTTRRPYQPTLFVQSKSTVTKPNRYGGLIETDLTYNEPTPFNKVYNKNRLTAKPIGSSYLVSRWSNKDKYSEYPSFSSTYSWNSSQRPTYSTKYTYKPGVFQTTSQPFVSLNELSKAQSRPTQNSYSYYSTTSAPYQTYTRRPPLNQRLTLKPDFSASQRYTTWKTTVQPSQKYTTRQKYPQNQKYSSMRTTIQPHQDYTFRLKYPQKQSYATTNAPPHRYTLKPIACTTTGTSSQCSPQEIGYNQKQTTLQTFPTESTQSFHRPNLYTFGGKLTTSRPYTTATDYYSFVTTLRPPLKRRPTLFETVANMFKTPAYTTNMFKTPAYTTKTTELPVFYTFQSTSDSSVKKPNKPQFSDNKDTSEKNYITKVGNSNKPLHNSQAFQRNPTLQYNVKQGNSMEQYNPQANRPPAVLEYSLNLAQPHLSAGIGSPVFKRPSVSIFDDKKEKPIKTAGPTSVRPSIVTYMLDLREPTIKPYASTTNSNKHGNLLFTLSPPNSNTKTPSSDKVNEKSFAIVNVWKRINGELKLLGQKLIPLNDLIPKNVASMMSGTLLDASQLSTRFVDQITPIFTQTTTESPYKAGEDFLGEKPPPERITETPQNVTILPEQFVGPMSTTTANKQTMYYENLMGSANTPKPESLDAVTDQPRTTFRTTTLTIPIAYRRPTTSTYLDLRVPAMDSSHTGGNPSKIPVTNTAENFLEKYNILLRPFTRKPVKTNNYSGTNKPLLSQIVPITKIGSNTTNYKKTSNTNITTHNLLHHLSITGPPYSNPVHSEKLLKLLQQATNASLQSLPSPVQTLLRMMRNQLIVNSNYTRVSILNDHKNLQTPHGNLLGTKSHLGLRVDQFNVSDKPTKLQRKEPSLVTGILDLNSFTRPTQSTTLPPRPARDTSSYYFKSYHQTNKREVKENVPIYGGVGNPSSTEQSRSAGSFLQKPFRKQNRKITTTQAPNSKKLKPSPNSPNKQFFAPKTPHTIRQAGFVVPIGKSEPINMTALYYNLPQELGTKEEPPPSRPFSIHGPLLHKGENPLSLVHQPTFSVPFRYDEYTTQRPNFIDRLSQNAKKRLKTMSNSLGVSDAGTLAALAIAVTPTIALALPFLGRRRKRHVNTNLEKNQTTKLPTPFDIGMLASGIDPTTYRTETKLQKPWEIIKSEEWKILYEPKSNINVNNYLDKLVQWMLKTAKHSENDQTNKKNEQSDHKLVSTNITKSLN